MAMSRNNKKDESMLGLTQAQLRLILTLQYVSVNIITSFVNYRHSQTMHIYLQRFIVNIKKNI